MAENNDFRSAFDAGQNQGELRWVKDRAPYVVLPGDAQAHSLEHLLLAPLRTKRAASLMDPASFEAYVNRFKIDGTTIFADQEKVSMTAVIDYPVDGNTPAWGEHKAVFTPRRSQEWARWMGSSGKRMKQSEFGAFFEENSIDVTSPDAATMREVSLNLRAVRKGEFVSERRLSNGNVEFVYKDETRATVGKGTLQVPEEFIVTIPVFFGGDRVNVRAMFRYRINDGGDLELWHDLHRPEYVLQDAFKAIVDNAKTATGVSVVYGAA